MRELIIEGQHVDLAPDTDITLEYVNNIAGDIGKINLSKSYTIKLPKSARNARILDDPGRPGHESRRTRRFMDARFYRNGIDLLGPAQAYILKTTAEGYEIALVWNTLESLQKLSQSAADINDLPGLPVLQWIGPNGATPDYTSGTDGAFFASYVSGLGVNRYPNVNVAPHPSMSVPNLVQRIFTSAGVPYRISAAAAEAMSGKAVLAAPNHKPNRQMELESGSVAGSVSLQSHQVGSQRRTSLATSNWTNGWDAPRTEGGYGYATGDNATHRALLNLKTNTAADLSTCAIVIKGVQLDGAVITESEEIARAYFQHNGHEWVLYFDEEIKLSGWPNYTITLDFSGDVSTQLSAYDGSLPLLALNRVHPDIDIENDNRFPLQGNLPEIKQWDFIKACMALFGWVPIIKNGVLNLKTYDEATDPANAYDWTAKAHPAPAETGYTLDGWAQQNLIVFEDDAPLGFDPNVKLTVEDKTLSESRDIFKLPFAASMQGEAQHYKVKDDGTVEDIDISPRIFNTALGLQGLALTFDADMYGQGLASAHYERLQAIVQKPVTVQAHIRLHEIDLATLDLGRPVYLGQFGQYYTIRKIQTSGSDLCKVELIQLP